MFFEHADCLVGVCKDVDALSSQLLTLELKGYDEGPADLPEDALASPASSSGKSPAGPSSDTKGRGSSDILGKRKVQTKLSRRTKLQTVGEEEEKFSLVEGEGDNMEDE